MRFVQLFLLSLALMVVAWACVDDETARYDSRCRTDPRFEPEHNLPEEWGLLLDSRDTENLITGVTDPPWKIVDSDGDGDQFSQRGGICQYDLRACAFASGPQDNWVFTPFIRFPDVPNVDDVTQVFFDITFRFAQCSGNPACSNDYVTIYKYETDTATTAGQINPANYIPNPLRDTVMDSRLQQAGLTDVRVMWSIPKPNTRGFYLGFRDQGTCGQIGRIFSYYLKSPAYSGTLLSCPSVPLPPEGSSEITSGSCCCGDRAENKSSLERVCSADGSCSNPASDVCGCTPGYEYVGGECIACLAGTFQPDISIESRCVSCPANSEASFPAAPVCNCTGATIRDINSPRDPCTESPSSPILTVEPVVDGTFVTVCWRAALDSGGLNDLHYNVYISQPDSDDSVTSYRKVNGQPITGSGDICYDVSGLNAMTSYAVIVTSANGATGDPETLDQTLSNEQGRFLAFFVDTGEAGLRKGEAIAVTFFVTLLVVATVTALIVFLIMWFVCVKKDSTMATSPKNGLDHKDYHADNKLYELDSNPPTKPPPIRPARPPPRRV